MYKRTAKNKSSIGVGQLAFTFGFPQGTPKDDAQETEGNGPQASSASSVVGSKRERKRKWNSLIDKVYALPNLWSAWQRVKANNGAAGIDGMTVKRFAENDVERLEQLAAELRAKSYRPQPVRRKLIPKSGGGSRPLGIPTVRDRIVQQALLQILEPVFEAKFSNRSHGFRKDRGCATALSVVDRAVRHGYTHVVDADIQTFFDTVDHEKLLAAVNEEVADGSVLKLIRHILTAGVVMPGAGDVEPTELGTPQGGPLSPLLANIYLHRLDVRMVEEGFGLIRYADDFVIFAKSEDEATQALTLAREILEGELGLVLHPEKTRVVSVAAGFEFLGFHYFRDPKTGLMAKEVRRKSVQRFREAVRLRTPGLHAQRAFKPKNIVLRRLAKNQRIRSIIHNLNLYLTGWHWYFKPVWGRYDPPFGSFDGFVRRRVRLAITGRVGSGWWNQLITNRLLGQLGLLSITELHSKYLAGHSSVPARKG